MTRPVAPPRRIVGLLLFGAIALEVCGTLLLRASDGLREARRALDLQAEQARAELGALPAGPARDALATLLDYTVERTG